MSRTVKSLGSVAVVACLLGFGGLEAAGDELYDVADSIRRGPIDTILQSLVERNGDDFASQFSAERDAMLWDREDHAQGRDAIKAWINHLFEFFPVGVECAPAAPRVLIHPNGNESEAWAVMRWSWGEFQGVASGKLRHEEGEWRMATMDFFGSRLESPTPEFDPRPWYAAVGAVEEPVQRAAEALASGNVLKLAALGGDKEVSCVDDTGQRRPLSVGITGPLEGTQVHGMALYVSPGSRRAIAHQPDVGGHGVSLALVESEGQWQLRTVSFVPMDVLAVDSANRQMTTWARVRASSLGQ